MVTLASRKRREVTNAAKHTPDGVVYTSSGVYYPTYGKKSVYLSGHGVAGTSSSGGSYAGTNEPEPGNIAGYNPDTPGTVAGYNPPEPGNYAGTYPPYPGTPVDAYMSTFYELYLVGKEIPGDPQSQPSYYTTFVLTAPLPEQSPITSYDIYNDSTHYNEGYQSLVYVYIPGYTNPSSPGADYYNPPTPGVAYYNPPVSGNPNYNPSTPGYDYYNGSDPGVAGTPFTVMSVTFPGGGVGQPAPVVGDTLVTIDYTAAGIAINVPAGGSVTIKETWPSS